MRKFTSYGSPNPKLHYVAPRQALLDSAYHQLIGQNPEDSGHYITVWAPRQTGKTWALLEVTKRIRQRDDFQVGIITMQSVRDLKNEKDVLKILINSLSYHFETDLPMLQSLNDLPQLFTQTYFSKPIILILDEFDSLDEGLINKFANEFRTIYTSRINESDKPSGEKQYLLHGLALIGVRSVLGIGNVKGSPFNVQRGLHIPNLSFDEVRDLFQQYEQESGQSIEPDVVKQLFHEMRGQPGLTCWMGELLTETYNENPKESITKTKFDQVYYKAVRSLPNNNILNILSKVNQAPYRDFTLELFRTEEKIEFAFDNVMINYLYTNGVIDREITPTEEYVRFASPFVQKRIFNRFSQAIFDYTGKLFEPFEDLSDIITETAVNIKNLLMRYQIYLQKNRGWLLKDAPRRKDLRIFEAVFHFNLYRYLYDFFNRKRGQVFPEFPAGNGKIDLIVKYQGLTYGIEVKSYTDELAYKEALQQAAAYGHQLHLQEITLAFFVEYIDDANRQKYEQIYTDEASGVIVTPVFVVTGN